MARIEIYVNNNTHIDFLHLTQEQRAYIRKKAQSLIEKKVIEKKEDR